MGTDNGASGGSGGDDGGGKDGRGVARRRPEESLAAIGVSSSPASRSASKMDSCTAGNREAMNMPVRNSHMTNCDLGAS